MPSRVAIVFSGDRHSSSENRDQTRLAPVFQALTGVGLTAEPAPYSDQTVDDVRRQLLAADAALIWVDPLTDGQDRATLDALLREVAAAGVLVSAHPDVILKMGTKEVLYRTRELGWGTDTYLYQTAAEFSREFPPHLSAAGPRVLKQYRGNGGQGVWKVELVSDSQASPSALVRVQHAQIRDSVTDETQLHEFMQQCHSYFAAEDGHGRLIDQAFQPRVEDGLIRCYLVKNQVVGFARQYAKGRSPAELASLSSDGPAKPAQIFGLPSPKTMYPADEPAFAALRHDFETDWLPGMQRVLDVDLQSLPLLWDADFLFGPPDAAGQDTYVLCEINVSSIIPFPAEAPAALARSLLESLRQS